MTNEPGKRISIQEAAAKLRAGYEAQEAKEATLQTAYAALQAALAEYHKAYDAANEETNRTNPRTRNIRPDNCMHDVVELARMLGTGIAEATHALRVLDAAGHLKLLTNKPEKFSRFTVRDFDTEAFIQAVENGSRFRDLKDILGIDDE